MSYHPDSLMNVKIDDSLIEELLEIAIRDQEESTSIPKIYFYEQGDSDLSNTEVRGLTFEFGLITTSKRAAVLGMKLIMLLEGSRTDFWYFDLITYHMNEDREYSTEEIYDLLTRDTSDIDEYDLTDTFETVIYTRNFQAEESKRYSERKTTRTIVDVKTLYTLETIKQALFF